MSYTVDADPEPYDTPEDENSDECDALLQDGNNKRKLHGSERPLRRGRPRKPDPVIDMTASRFVASNKILNVKIEDPTKKGGSELVAFPTNPPRVTKAGKVGWTFSQKVVIEVDGVDVTFQVTGNVYGIRSDKWKR